MVEENLAAPRIAGAQLTSFIAAAYRVANFQPAAEQLLRDLELVEKRDARVKTLSGGQKRRLDLGVALDCLGQAPAPVGREPRDEDAARAHRRCRGSGPAAGRELRPRMPHPRRSPP